MVLLPFLALILLILLLESRYPHWGWQKAILRSMLIWFSVVVVSTELLSLAAAIGRVSIGALWLIICLLVGMLLIHGHPKLKPRWPSELADGWLWKISAAGIVLILAITAIVAFVAPPNTWDSLNYHMARVAHWAQQGSVKHFATGIEVQNGIGPFAEYAILHLYVLTPGDRFANFIEWLAMLGSLVAVSQIAGQLGAGKTGRWLAVMLTACLPMGIAQASSTMTDYVVALLVAATASEAVSIQLNETDHGTYLFIGLSASLAIGVKPTAYAFLVPFALYVAILTMIRSGLRSLFSSMFLVLSIAVILNSGHITRNVITFGNPFGDPNLASSHANQMKNLKGVTSNLLRHASLHAGTPWESWNDFINRGIIKIHLLMDVSPSDPRTTSVGEYGFWPPRQNETVAGNPFQAYLILIAIAISFLLWRRFSRLLFIYQGVALSTLIIFSYVFKWQVFSSRYHMAFFVLFMPAVSLVLEKALPEKLALTIGITAMILAWPWLLELQERPLIRSEKTHGRSILAGPRDRWYFDGTPRGLYSTYKDIVDEIQEADCRRIGLMISGGSAEYPFWVYLGEPISDFQIEWVISDTPSERYRDYRFKPCAVICQNCPPSWIAFGDLPNYDTYGEYRLFMRAPKDGDASSPE